MNKSHNLRGGTIAVVAFIVSTVLSVGAQPSRALVKSEKCNARLPGNSGPDMAARISCYFEEMLSIKQEKDDIQLLLRTGVAIRGQKVQGFAKRYRCRVLTGTKTHYLLHGASGGRCTNEWNKWIRKKEQYLNWYCHVGLAYNGEVKQADIDSKSLRMGYERCFTREIPSQITIEYPITDHASFVHQLTKIRQAYKRDNLAAEFYDLAQLCNATIVALRQSHPLLITKNGLRCGW